MGIAETLSHCLTDFRCFAGPHPDYRVGAGNIGELELINAVTGIFGFLKIGIVKGSHVFSFTDFFKGRVFIPNAFPFSFFFTLLR